MTHALRLAAAVLSALAGSISAACAQTPGSWGSWGIGTVVLPGSLTRKWGGYAEAQVRTNHLPGQYFYNELKGGLSYDLSQHFTLLLGGGRYHTFDAPGPINLEKRLWEQLVLVQLLSRLKLEHRYRVEQRWLTFPDDSTVFRQRLRYRLNAFLPLNQRTITDHTVFVSVYDELFLNPRGPVFERNRVYAGLGYQLNAHLTLQAGWVRQANYTQPTLRQGQLLPLGTSAKNNVVLNLIYKLTPGGAPRPETLPSQQD